MLPYRFSQSYHGKVNEKNRLSLDTDEKTTDKYIVTV